MVLTLDLSDIELIITESTFNITSYKLQSGHLINLNSKYHMSTVELKNTTITFTALVYEITYIGVMAISAREWRIKDSQIVCPVGMKVTETIQTNILQKWFYDCQKNCDSNAYTFQTGSMVLHGELFNSMSSFIYDGGIKNTLVNLPEPICKLCPVGANCSSKIKALPNYWGLRNEKDDVTMVRSPDGYCCQTIDSCEEIDSCGSGRLCGGCKKNFTESLFDPTCVLIDKCHTGLIMMLYIFCIVGYGLGLMLMGSIKYVGVPIIKTIYRRIKEKFPKKSNTKMAEKNQEESDIKTKEDGSFKYLQILFYYVQDATLIKVHLPSKILEETSTIVKILQFSPEVLTSIYTKSMTCASVLVQQLSPRYF